jgi:hypothetical protein
MSRGAVDVRRIRIFVKSSMEPMNCRRISLSPSDGERE